MAGHQETAPLVVLVSGVTTDLGKTIAYTVSEEGGRPILMGETGTRDELSKIAKHCGCIGAPSTVDIHPIQLHSKETVDQLCFNVLSRQGALDILINNPEGNPGTWDTEILLNLVGHFATFMGERDRGVTLINLDHKEPEEVEKRLSQYKNLTIVQVKKDEFDTGEKIRKVFKEGLGLGNLSPADPPLVTGDDPIHEPIGGIVAATGARQNSGMLCRKTKPGEMNKAVSDYCGAVMQPVDPKNLEPERDHEYKDEPERTPEIVVQCYKPFNGEPPHGHLIKNFLTPNDIFYVRNHLPVPNNRGTIDTHKIVLEADREFNLGRAELTVQDLKNKFAAVTITVTLQCAGNRRNDMCAVETVSGRAPWNAGSISNAEWTGVRLRDLARYIGLDPDRAEDVGVKWVTSTGLDWHRMTSQHFEASISAQKGLDFKGDVIVAYAMNGQELPPDHGYPVRLIVPGYVGTRSVKWLQRICFSPTDSQSPWQQVDYRPAPSSVKVHEQAKPQTCAPLMALPVQSAILMPTAGSIIASQETSIKVCGYAWSGGGHAIVRVDVSWDEGKNWAQAKFTEHQQQPESRAWAWALWEIRVPIPDEKKAVGGKMELRCKAFDDAWNTQPRTTEEIWNYRGLNCNSWHSIPINIQQGAPRGTATGLLEKAGVTPGSSTGLLEKAGAAGHGLVEKAEQGMQKLGLVSKVKESLGRHRLTGSGYRGFKGI